MSAWISAWPWQWLGAWACAWGTGLLVAVGLGHFFVEYPLNYIRKKMDGLEKPSTRSNLPAFDLPVDFPPPLILPAPKHVEVPARVTGGIERVFFTILVGSGVDGYPTAMMAWLALKLASNWNHKDMEGKPGARAFALTALLAGLVSLLFAFWGGSIVKRLLPT
jgi:hypothetical protein